jgi:hypothetical protein
LCAVKDKPDGQILIACRWFRQWELNRDLRAPCHVQRPIFEVEEDVEGLEVAVGDVQAGNSLQDAVSTQKTEKLPQAHVGGGPPV